MFDASEQFQQFMISSSRTSSSPPLPFPLSFEPTINIQYNPHHLLHQQQHQHQHQHLSFQPQPQPCPNKFHHDEETDLEINSHERERSEAWTADEVVALLRVRSTLESWFPHFTWEHVSRKLGELGFKRSAEKCKEKFQEESRELSYTKNYMSFQTELDHLYHAQHQTQSPLVHNNNNNKPSNDDINEGEEEEEEEEEQDKIGTDPHDDDGDGLDDNPRVRVQEHEHEHDDVIIKESKLGKMKRKREDKFEILKGFCEDLVMKMVAKHEEMHQKLIEDMVKRDEEKLCKEEAWKHQEMDRINKELDIRAQQHSIACLKQASIIDFLNSYTPTSTSSPQNPNNDLLSSQTPNSHHLPEPQHADKISTPTKHVISLGSDTMLDDQKDENGKRWPRDEVLALISLRASLYTNVEECGGESRREGLKGPLWERMSQGMRELGYKRSAKRCKEKWENINKYFRKTKNGNKKRTLESRTCPYFHQLSALYNQGNKLVQPSSSPENRSSLPDEEYNNNKEEVQQGEKDMVQIVADDKW